MGVPSVGAVVLVPFPFSDLTQAKLRPAVVLGDAGRGDFILCQVTSNPYGDPLAIELTTADFASGTLERVSYARPGKLFTANSTLVVRQVALLTAAARERISDRIVALFRGTATK